MKVRFAIEWNKALVIWSLYCTWPWDILSVCSDIPIHLTCRFCPSVLIFLLSVVPLLCFLHTFEVINVWLAQDCNVTNYVNHTMYAGLNSDVSTLKLLHVRRKLLSMSKCMYYVPILNAFAQTSRLCTMDAPKVGWWYSDEIKILYIS